MSRLRWMAGIATLCIASTHCYPNFTFGGAGGGDAGEHASHGASSSSSSGVTCAQVDGAFGCCDKSNNLHYCQNDGTLASTNCQQLGCGWDPGNGYYNCGYSGSDPLGVYTRACPP